MTQICFFKTVLFDELNQKVVLSLDIVLNPRLITTQTDTFPECLPLYQVVEAG